MFYEKNQTEGETPENSTSVFDANAVRKKSKRLQEIESGSLRKNDRNKSPVGSRIEVQYLGIGQTFYEISRLSRRSVPDDGRFRSGPTPSGRPGLYIIKRTGRRRTVSDGPRAGELFKCYNLCARNGIDRNLSECT